MDSTPPQPIGSGQRLLAAIVFTDVVSFSARMQTEEVATLSLLERDFAEMRKTCEKYSGSVLKTTGDGLLLYFPSAVNAVACAQKMQRVFAERARTEPADETLTHRVGIHLGDVFVNNEDVMGDGVNIAARLQAQAEPGGICISQTVYDVVKNKLELDVVKLEPRELKNISESVPMYRVLLEAPKPRRLRPRPVPSPLLKAGEGPPPPFFTRTQKLGIVAALLLALGITASMLVNAYVQHEDELAQSQASQAALKALLKAKGNAADQSTSSAPRPENPAATTEIDFAELARRSGGRAARSPENAPTRRAAEALVPALFAWVDAALQRYTEDRQLLVRSLPGSNADDLQVFSRADHRMYFAEGGASRARSWSDLKPEVVGAIVAGVLSDAHAPHEIVRAADAYAWLNELPGLTAALHQGDK